MGNVQRQQFRKVGYDLEPVVTAEKNGKKENFYEEKKRNAAEEKENVTNLSSF